MPSVFISAFYLFFNFSQSWVAELAAFFSNFNLFTFFNFSSFIWCLHLGGPALTLGLVFSLVKLCLLQECHDRDYSERWFVFIVCWMESCTLQKHSTLCDQGNLGKRTLAWLYRGRYNLKSGYWSFYINFSDYLTCFFW